MSIALEIEEHARGLGAELFGVTTAEPFALYIETAAELENTRGLKDVPQASQRINQSLGDPRNMLPDARSIIILGVFCRLKNVADNSLEYEGPHAQPASYWRHGRPVIVGIADSVAEYLQGKGFDSKGIDTRHGRVPLKAAAARAGLGHPGKNTLLYTKEFGSWVSLVGVVTNARLEPTGIDAKDICGKCTKCIEACPTGAIYEPYKVDILKCISYLNHSNLQDVGEITDLQRKQMGTWICGCEICQNVCPRNKKVEPRDLSTSFNVPWHGINIPDMIRLPLSEILQMLEGEVGNYFQRYTAICMGNMGGAEDALPALKKMLASEDPLVRKYAQWAINRIEKALF